MWGAAASLPSLIEAELRGEGGSFFRRRARAAEAFLGPDLDACQRTDRDGFPLEARVRPQCRRDEQAAIGIECDFVRVCEEMPHETAVAFVLHRCCFESFAKCIPGRLRIEREARIGLGDGNDELRPEPIPKARGYDETALVIKSRLGTTGKARDIASQEKTSTSPHQAPLCPTIARPSRRCKTELVKSVPM